MKRNSVGKLLLMAGILAMAASAKAALTDTVVLTVTPTGTRSVSIDRVSFDFGALNLASTGTVSSSSTVTNDGNIVSTWGVRLSVADGVWVATNTTTGADRYILYGIFNAAAPLATAFTLANHHIVGTQRDSSGTVYAGTQTGLSVPVSATRGLWFRLDMPTSSSVSTQRSFTVEVEAKP